MAKDTLRKEYASELIKSGLRGKYAKRCRASSNAVLVGIGVVLGTHSASAAERAPLKGVTAVRAGNYGAPSKWVRQRGEVGPIVEELNELRRKPWRQGDTKMTCYSTVILLAGEKQVALFRMRPDMIVERPSEKGESSWSLKLADTDLPRLRQVLAEAPKKCE